MPQSKKSTTPRTPVSRTSRGMGGGPKPTASAPKKTITQKTSTLGAMDDKAKGTEKSQVASAKRNRARCGDSGS